MKDDPEYGIDASLSGLQRLAGPLFDVLAGSELAVLVTDSRREDGAILFVNSAFCRWMGCIPAEVLGRSCTELEMLETDARRRCAADSSVRPQSSDADSDFRSRMIFTPILNDAGAPAFFVATQRDIPADRLVARQVATCRSDSDGTVEPFLTGTLAAWNWDVARRMVSGDAGFATLYGLSTEAAALGMPAGQFFSIIHEHDQPRIRLAVGAVLRGAEIFSKEFRIRVPGSGVRWVQARGRFYGVGQDKAGHFVGTLVDITDQKRVEERLRIAQTAGGIGTFEHVSGFGTVSVSRQFCHLLGLQPATDLPLRTVNALVLAGDPRIVEPVDQMARQAEFRIIRPDTGELRWLIRRGETLIDTETGETRLCGVVYDITDVKRAEAKLRSLNESLEATIVERTADRNRLWHLSADIMFVARTDGTITAINPAWTSILGWSEADLVGNRLLSLVHADDAANLLAETNVLAESESLRRFEVRCSTKAGDWRWISWSAASGSGLVYAVGRDVSAEKLQAETLRQTEEQLRQAQKMEAIGQLTGGLAHDFNNLLTGIIGGLAMLKLRLAQGRTSQVERYIAVAQESASRAAALTHRLLAFSRRQTLDPVATQPNDLISGMQDLVSRTLGPEIALKMQLAPGLWPTLCDPSQLENALLNLCINSRDAMPGGGNLTIETANAWLNAHAARERTMAAGEYIMISVSDTGTGMPPEVIARAFDPFFTTKPLGRGTGLGLSMIYGFAKQSGGQVQIHSELGIGTKVRIYLPRYEGPVVDIPKPEMNLHPDAVGNGKTALVIDDDAAVRMVVCDALTELGYSVFDAVNGALGLQVLHANKTVDLLVTDVGLPGGLNGRQVADAARTAQPNLKILFVTGYDESIALGENYLDPGMYILPKPFTLDTLFQKITTIEASA